MRRALVLASSLVPMLVSCTSSSPRPAEGGPAPAASAGERAIEVIPLQYAVAGELARTLTETFASHDAESRARIVADQRTNSLIVQADARELERIRELIARLDVQVR